MVDGLVLDLVHARWGEGRGGPERRLALCEGKPIPRLDDPVDPLIGTQTMPLWEATL